MMLLEYILALLGITLLCALWIKFQLWLKKVDPQRNDFKPGCGACQSGSCGTVQGKAETMIKMENIAPAAKPHFRGNQSGENECVERKSP